MGDQAELMVLLCVRAKINSYNNSEHLPVCGMSGVERGTMDFKFDADMRCLKGSVWILCCHGDKWLLTDIHTLNH